MWNDKELKEASGKDMPFPMLSDQNGNIGKQYGVYDEEAGINGRAKFIIDPDGVLQGFEVLTPALGRSVSETLRQIRALRVIRDSQGKSACPSDWKEGDETLTPGEDLVGNVWKTIKKDGDKQ